MRCPFCRADNDKVTDSRSLQDGFVIRRRRLCNECGRRYTTYEQLEDSGLKVVKKDGSRVPFDRERIKAGLARACWKRPISDEQLEEVVAQVENSIYGRYEAEVESRVIGELLMARLRRLDQIAFVRFASVYREFQDVQDFVQELGPMLEDPPLAGTEPGGAQQQGPPDAPEA